MSKSSTSVNRKALKLDDKVKVIITSGIILRMNLALYKGFTLEITNKW
jgi:hypothetical protein